VNQLPRGSVGFRIPWWPIVGGIGFLLFGGWRGFFGAIVGVLLLPLALFAALAVVMVLFVWWKSRRLSRGATMPPPSPPPRGSVIDAEAVVVDRGDD